MEIYWDLVVILNFFVDLFLLLGTNRLAGVPSRMVCVVPAALLGAAYSAVCLLGSFRFLGNLLWRTVCLGGMSAIAFGLDRSGWKRGLLFLLLSMALGGIALCLGRSDMPSMVLSAGGVWLLCAGANTGSEAGEKLPLQIKHDGVYHTVLALRDTGNSLRDPVTGEPVLVVGPEMANKLTGLTKDQLMHPLETMVELPGFRMIPYRTVGQTSGMMLAMRFPEVKVGSRIQSAVVAFAPEEIVVDGKSSALVGGTRG